MAKSQLENNKQKKHRWVELMALIVIGALAYSAWDLTTGPCTASKSEKAGVDIATFKTALEIYHSNSGRYPSSKEGLSALVDGKVKYLKLTTIPLDPWENPYVYRSPGEHSDFELISYGPDGVRGGEDDIVPQADTETADAQ